MLCPAYIIKINKFGSYKTDYSANKIPQFCGSQKASKDNEVTPFCVANAANDLPLYVALRQPLSMDVHNLLMRLAWAATGLQKQHLISHLSTL